MIDKCDDCHCLLINEPADGCSSVNHWRCFYEALKEAIAEMVKERKAFTEKIVEITAEFKKATENVKS